jgi:hypothetical protein
MTEVTTATDTNVTDANTSGDVATTVNDTAPTTTGQSSTVVDNGWYSKLGDEELSFLDQKGWKADDGIQKMLKSYRNLESLRGVPEEQLMRIPADGDVEGWNGLYDKIGRPKIDDGYKYEPKEGVQVDKDSLEWFNNAAYKAGLTNKQHNQVIDMFNEYQASIEQKHNEMQQIEVIESKKRLQSSWGADYDKNFNIASAALADMFNIDPNSEDAALKISQVLGSDKAAKFFYENAHKLGNAERDMIGINTNDGFTSPVKQASKDRESLLSEIKNDPVRLNQYNKQKGADWERAERLKRIVYGN